MIVIIDYNAGNIGSVYNMLNKIGCNAVMSSRSQDIERAEKIILPGVGAFDTGMDNLSKLGLAGILTDRVVNKKVPILGICLGMQLMTCSSEEGNLPGLAWVNARTVKFRFAAGVPPRPLPHIGWEYVTGYKHNPLFTNMYQNPKFYFVHSYHVCCDNPEDALCSAHYVYEFTAGFTVNNIWGVQFHPEKSHKYGMKFLENFISL